MTRLLIGLEALALAGFYGMVCIGLARRLERRLWRGVILALGLLPPLLFGAAICVGTWNAGRYMGHGWLWFAGATLSTVVLALAFGWALRRPERLELWLPPARGATCMALALALFCITFWNADLMVQLRMANWRIQAGALASSVAPARVPDRANAALVYAQAFERMQGEQSEPEREWLAGRGAAPDTRQGSAVARLRNNAQALQLLRRAADLPECRWERNYAEPRFDMLLPELVRLREGSRLLALGALARAQGGQAAAALRDAGRIFELARHTASESLLISALVAMAIEETGFRALETVVALSDPGQADWRLPAVEQPLRSPQRLLARCFQMEEAFGVSAFAGLAEEDGSLSMHDIGGPRMGPFSGLALAVWRVFLLPEDLASYRRWMARYHELLSRSFHESGQLRRDLARRLKQPEGGLLTQALLPALHKTTERAAETEARFRLCRLALAVQRHRKQHGRFPAKLADLAEPTPLDPFDGKPLRMWSGPNAVRLYSVGHDQKDDQGRERQTHREKGNLVFVIPRDR